MMCLTLHESYEVIWLVIALFTVTGMTSGFLAGYGLGIIRK